MTEFTKYCVALVVADLILVAAAFGYFHSDAARCAIFATIIGSNISMAFRLVEIRRRERSKGVHS